MNKTLVLEEVNRINFLMNYDSSKLVTEQKVDFVSENLLSEQVTQQNQQQLTPEQIKVAKQKIQQQAVKTAQTIYGELLKAFDMDGDKDLKDSDGTNEGGALTAIKKIKNRETLDALNNRIAMTKQYPNLKSWLNAEMSDFDSEYGDIWSKLEKMGYAGANRNILLKFAGQTSVGQLIKSADKAIDALRSMTFEQIMEGFRDIVSGAGGTVATLILSVIPGGQAVNALIFGTLFAFDIHQFSQGKGDWFNTITDSLSMILAGVGTIMAPAKTVLAGEKTAASFFSKMAQNFPKIFSFFKNLGGKIVVGAGKVVSLISQGIQWIGKTFPFLAKAANFLKSMINKVSTFLKSIETAIVDATKTNANKLTKTVANKLTKTVAGKTAKSLAIKTTNYLTSIGNKAAEPLLAKAEQFLGEEGLKSVKKETLKQTQKFIKDQGKNLTINQSRNLVCSKLGEKYCTAFDVVMGVVATKEAASGTLKSAKDTKDTLSTINNSGFNNLQKFSKGVEGTKKGVETIKKATKTDDESKQLTRNVSSLNV